MTGLAAVADPPSNQVIISQNKISPQGRDFYFVDLTGFEPVTLRM